MNVGDPHFLFAPGGQFTWTMSNIHSAVRRLTTRIPEVSKLPDWYSNDHIIFIFDMRPIGSPKAHISLLRDLTGSGAKTSCQSVTKSPISHIDPYHTDYDTRGWRRYITRPLLCWICFSKYENIFTIWIIYQQRVGQVAGLWNPSPWETKACLYCMYIVISIVAGVSLRLSDIWIRVIEAAFVEYSCFSPRGITFSCLIQH